MDDFHYSDCRFRMPYAGRLAVRFLTYVGGALVVVSGLVLSMSDLWVGRAISIAIWLVVICCVLYFRKARPGRLSFSAYHSIEIALDRTALDQSDFTLNLFGELIKSKRAQAALAAIGIQFREFASKIDSRRKRMTRPQPKEEVLSIIDACVRGARDEAQAAGGSIQPSHLLKAMLQGEFFEVAKVFEVFGHTPADALH